MATEIRIIDTSGAYVLRYRPAGMYAVGSGFDLFMDEHWQVLRQAKAGLEVSGFNVEADARSYFNLVTR